MARKSKKQMNEELDQILTIMKIPGDIVDLVLAVTRMIGAERHMTVRSLFLQEDLGLRNFVAELYRTGLKAMFSDWERTWILVHYELSVQKDTVPPYIAAKLDSLYKMVVAHINLHLELTATNEGYDWGTPSSLARALFMGGEGGDVA